MSKLLSYTLSVCPYCLKEIPAKMTAEQGAVYMEKSCPEHGSMKTLIWEDSPENYLKWLEDGGIRTEDLPGSEEEVYEQMREGEFAGCAQVQPCSAALMTTNRCNMNCPVCFTRKKGDPRYEPTVDACRAQLAFYRTHAGEDGLVELCGGEPTVREDLPEIAEAARALGFSYVQLNTNGLRLSESTEYCQVLKDSGVTTVYLGFDGVREGAYTTKYGRNLFDEKRRAVENCAKAGLAVVLVPCVIPGSNDDQLGEIIRFAKGYMPAVRGVYFQPVSYFGIYPEGENPRITIPEVIRRLEAQTGGEVKNQDFLPGAYEHAACTFQGIFLCDGTGKLRSLNRRMRREKRTDGYRSIRKSTKLLWLPGDQRMLSIGGMAFQDAWNLDLLRIRRCSVQIIGRDRQMRPLCTKYLSDIYGNKLCPGIA